MTSEQSDLGAEGRHDATTTLRESVEGDPDAKNKLFALLQQDLRAKAEAFLRSERPGHTLQATAIVNEAWMRLINQDRASIEDEAQFMKLASLAMRRILVDHARAKKSDKRGGGRRKLELDEELPAVEAGESLDLVAVDEALARLKLRSERLASVVEMRFFGGLTLEEVARVRGVDRATVVRDWTAARSLLSEDLKSHGFES